MSKSAADRFVWKPGDVVRVKRVALQDQDQHGDGDVRFGPLDCEARRQPPSTSVKKPAKK